MSNTFNPYAEWLDLPPDLAAPDYYALLGLPQLESDVSQVAPAADRAMSKVRACKPGAHAAAWAKLLDEISAAKSCLTNAAEKAAYDQQLNLGAGSPAAGNAAPTNPNMYPPGAQSPAAVPQQAMPVTPQPVEPVTAPASTPHQPPAAAAVNPMDPMAPAPMPVPGAGAPAVPAAIAPAQQPLGQAPSYPQTMPQASPASAMPATVPAAIPQTPAAVPVQPVGPVPVATPQVAPVAMPAPVQAAPVQAAPLQAAPAQPAPLQAAPVHAASVQAAPVAQQPGGAEPVAAAPPDVKRKRSATAMAMQRSSGGVILPVLIGGGVGMVVLLVAGVAMWLGKNEPPVVETEVARVDPSPPAAAPTRVDPSELPQAPVQEVTPVSPEPPITPPEIPRMDVSTPEPMVEPEPAPAPPPAMPEPEPMQAGPTREELRALAEALTTARSAIGEQDFALVDAQLAKAEGLAREDAHKAKLRRLTSLADYVRKFRAAIDQTVAGLEVGDQVPYNDSISFGVVEKGPNLLIVRVNGQNRRYALNSLQPGLARRLGEMSLDQGNPETLALQAAFVSVMPNATDADLAKTRDWWDGAAAIADVPDLIAAINDDYSLQQDLASAPLDPNAMDQLSGFMERLKDARTLDDFAKEFQSAIDNGIERLEPDMELEVGGSTIVTIEEVQSERILVQLAGLRRGLRRDDLPLGFAAAVAAQTIPRDVPLAMVMKGAYYAARDRDRPEKQFRSQVLAWWKAAGEANRELQPVVDELAKQYPE